MNVIGTRKSWAFRAVHIGAFALVLCAPMPNAWAKPRNPDPSRSVLVVAHIQFEGKSSTDMTLQTQANGDRYLYVEHSPEQGVSILDMRNPSEPAVVRSVAWAEAATTHMRDVAGEGVLITDADANSAAIQPATQAGNDSMVLWDTSMPKCPKVVQRFENVSKVLSDDRGYIYILNSEGLWVISTPTSYRQGDPDAPQNHVEYGGGG